MHVGVDAQSKVLHSVVTTPAKTADCRVLGQLLHVQERRVRGDRAYKESGTCHSGPRAQDPRSHQSAVQVEALHRQGDQGEESHEVARPLARGAFHRVIKRVFGFTKLRRRGLAKNANRVLSR